VDGLAELLNEFTQAGCHGYLRVQLPARSECASRRVDSLYLTAIPV
jgi:hypothetical protein